MKFVATLPLMITFYVGLRMKHNRPQGEHLKSLKNYVPLSIAGTISRIAIMTLANILFFTYVISINYAQFNDWKCRHNFPWSSVILGSTLLYNAVHEVSDSLLQLTASHSYLVMYKFLTGADSFKLVDAVIVACYLLSTTCFRILGLSRLTKRGS